MGPTGPLRNTNFFAYTANVCRELQGLCGGFLQYLQGKPCNIYRFSLQSLQSCKYDRVFPADIAENPHRVPAIPCKHLQCNPKFEKRHKHIYGTFCSPRLDCQRFRKNQGEKSVNFWNKLSRLYPIPIFTHALMTIQVVVNTYL